MTQRSLGWIQNASDFNKLKNVVSIFVKNSYINKKLIGSLIPELIEDEDLKKEMISVLSQDEIEIKYILLKGRSVERGLGDNVKCSGIIQAVLPNQRGRKFSDDWTADCFLRWTIAIGLLNYDMDSDLCKISELGKEYTFSQYDTETEYNILIQAFLSYPPAVRILKLLEKQGHLTKFELGKQLGGLGEAGFTSIPQNLYVQAIELAPANKVADIRNNTEGTADKYARMIAGWLIKMELVQRIPKMVIEKVGNTEYSARIGSSYKITLKGIRELKRTTGSSSLPRIPKIVYWEMLATRVKDKNYIRNRRAHIIECLEKKEKTLSEIKKYLEDKKIIEDEITIKSEIDVLEAIGLNVEKTRETYSINDEITHLRIPYESPEKTQVLELKDKMRQKLKYINHRYLALIDLAYDGNLSKDFEIQTINLLTNELEFKGLRLGESRKPDGLIWYDKNGVIIDNKAYSAGYNLPIAQADEMIRYIEENSNRDETLNPNKWWLNFDFQVENFYFLFITSYLRGRFQDNLEYISSRTSTNGSAINVKNLLYLAEKIKSNKISHSDLFNYFQNTEITI